MTNVRVTQLNSSSHSLDASAMIGNSLGIAGLLCNDLFLVGMVDVSVFDVVGFGFFILYLCVAILMLVSRIVATFSSSFLLLLSTLSKCLIDLIVSRRLSLLSSLENRCCCPWMATTTSLDGSENRSNRADIGFIVTTNVYNTRNSNYDPAFDFTNRKYWFINNFRDATIFLLANFGNLLS